MKCSKARSLKKISLLQNLPFDLDAFDRNSEKAHCHAEGLRSLCSEDLRS